MVAIDKPTGGPHKWWRDKGRKDLKVDGVLNSEWYDEATLSRGGWHATYCAGLQVYQDSQSQHQQDDEPTQHLQCQLCARDLRRNSDKKRQKCVFKRAKSVQKQHGAGQCTVYQRWFHS